MASQKVTQLKKRTSKSSVPYLDGARDPVTMAVNAMSVLEDVESVLRAIQRMQPDDKEIAALIQKTIGRIQIEHNDLDCDCEVYERAERLAVA